MKIWMYKGGMRLVLKSGVGRAYEHQITALIEKEIAYTTKFRMDFDIVQLNTIFPDSLIAALLGKLMEKKVVYYAHSTMEDFKKSFRGSDFFAPLFKIWIKLCYNMGDVIITPTEYSKNLLVTYGIEKEIISLTNGIDLEFYKRNIDGGKRFRQKYHFSQKDKVIISVGHYIERKGIEDFVILAKKMPDYKFVWFGYTNTNLIPDKIRKMIQMNLPNLFFPGYVSKEELRDAYSGSDIFAFLTHEETEGIVLLEALAMKIPVLVRDIPIYETWLENRKHVYKGENITGFEQYIEKIVHCQVPLLIEDGYQKVKERSIDIVGKKLEAVYSNLISLSKEDVLVRKKQKFGTRNIKNGFYSDKWI